MTAKIFSFDAAKRAKVAPKKKKPAPTPKTVREIFEDVYADVIDEWQVCAVKNGLNNFIKKKIPAHARVQLIPFGSVDEPNFASDLNVLAEAELRLNMSVAVINPGTTEANPHGWLVSFHLDNEVYSAPPIMATEAYARALNILLFVELTAQLKKLKRI